MRGFVRAAVLIRFVLALGAAAVVISGCASGSSDDATEEARSRLPTDGFELTDVAEQTGLDFRHGAFRWETTPDAAAMMGGGVCWLDYDRDGWLDLFVVNSYAEQEVARWKQHGGVPATALFRNVEGRFTDVSTDAGADLSVRGNGCVAADLDLDGNTDLFVTTTRDNMLLWNEGDGTFNEGAGDAGLGAYGWHSGASVGDVNGDGWPDLFVAGYADPNNRKPDATGGFPNTVLGVRDLLYLSDGGDRGERVSFVEVGSEAGLEATDFEYGLGSLFSDFDLDGDLDLYVANDTNPNRLYTNVPWPGGAEADPAGLGFRFEERAARAGVADPNAGMGVAGGDYDGDGRTDLFVTNLRTQTHGVFRSRVPRGLGPSFVDEREAFGPPLGDSSGWGVSWADLDLDTDLDLVMVNGHVPLTDLLADSQLPLAYENLTAQGRVGRFADWGNEIGLSALGLLHGRGSAAADYDNDGDLDVAVNSVASPLVLLENTGPAGHWLELELDGFYPGARATATLPDGRELVREVLVGSSYLSSEDPRLHFGLGEAEEVAELSVHWPGGVELSLNNIAADQAVVVEKPE